MNFAAAEKIAAAVLYEGYMLYPYRATSTKNVQRWNFGTLYPRDYAEAQRPLESHRLLAECILKAGSNARIDVRARFLHLIRKQALASADPTSPDWDEGVERTCDLHDLPLAELVIHPLHHDFSFIATNTVSNGGLEPQHLAGRLTIQARLLPNGLYRLSLELQNLTPMEDAANRARSAAMLQAFVSAHLLLGIEGGEFVSLLETPEEHREAAAGCRNVGVFPVLVGNEGQRSMLLCSPIILYDYPQIAPESAGDFFDGTEMDEMLALRVLTLTDEEKQEMRGTDDRARKILERTETLPQDFLMKVHGAIRGMKPVTEAEPDVFPRMVDWDPLAEKPAVESVRVFGVELRAGDRVRLWPQKKADIIDMALEGKVALIEAIEQDFEDNIQLAVVLDDDPGREFGMMRQPGHRFFFSPEEVEPLATAQKAESA
jgi:hypothetical protein